MSLSLAHTTTPTRNKHNRGAASAVIEVTVWNCHNHDSGRYAGLGERKSHFLQWFLSCGVWWVTMSLSLAHTATPTSNGWIRGAILTVDGIIFNCRDHEYGRYRGLESHKGAVFLVLLFSVSWLGFIVARSSPHAHANTKENLFTWAPAAASWPNHVKRPFWAVFPHFNGFLGKIERNGARGSIPTAILHRKRYVWVALRNFYFLPTPPILNSSTKRLLVVEFFNLQNPNCKGIKFC